MAANRARVTTKFLAPLQCGGCDHAEAQAQDPTGHRLLLTDGFAAASAKAMGDLNEEATKGHFRSALRTGDR